VAGLYRRRFPAGRLFSGELAYRLAELTEEVGRPLSLLIDRKGHVLRVAVGDAKELPLPERPWLENRLSGTYLLHTHTGEGGLSRPDLYLSVLFLNRLDAIAVLETAAGRPRRAQLAHLVPPSSDEEDWRILPLRPYEAWLDFDLAGLVASLEEEFGRQARVRELEDGSGERVVLVGLDRGEGPAAEDALRELSELARSAGGVVVHSELVYRPHPDPKTLVGRGKLEELTSVAYHQNAGTLIFGTDLTPAQAREIERLTQMKVLDRTQLILDIFAQHARTPEAKAQVELAQLKYLLPRLVGRGEAMSRLGGGIGTRGPGETKLEVDRRRLQKRIQDLSKELEQIARRRREARKQRRRKGVPVVAVVGYTNAGKTTLARALAKKGEAGEDKLFATLRPLVRRGFLPGIGEVLYADTVGFIREMPEDLVTAFRATLEELADADVLLHVLDVSEEGFEERKRAVEALLSELGIERPVVLALNKTDRADPYDVELARERYGGVPVSAVKKEGLPELKEALKEALIRSGVKPAAWA